MPSKLTIEEIQQIAKSKGGKCLFKKYINSSTHLKFQCKNGHTWKARPGKIKRGQWCPHYPCNKAAKGSIERMQEIAKKVDKYGNGKCLSITYINSTTELEWKCGDKTHPPFKKIPTYVSQGHWCEKCGGSEKGTIEKAYIEAKKKRGKCLSTKYKNARSLLKWECKEGHQFFKSYNKVKSSNSWCNKCSRREKGTIEEMHKLAASHGGKCLSTEYKNSNTKLLWKCKDKTHLAWKATPSSVKSGSWCMKCAGKEKGTIEEMQQIAKERSGKCLSSTYVNTENNLKWQCHRGHEWNATPHSIKSSQWCPTCTSNRGELICRNYFEQLFKAKFKKTKPSWLLNSKKNKLELDGFNKDLKIAFEHHGRQHYEWIKIFHKTKDEFLRRKADDDTKKELCKKNNITLIVIPEIPTLTKIENLKTFIKNECSILGYPIPKDFDKTKVKIDNLYNTDDLKLIELKSYASRKGGECLSERYLGSQVNLTWKCNNTEHPPWLAPPTRILSNKSWCQKCAGNEKKTIQQMHEYAKRHKGILLSNHYINTNTPLKWQCKNGHTFEKSHNRMTNTKNFCPDCSPNKKGNIQDMKFLAIERWNGQCLSDVYINSKTKLEWKCKNNTHSSFFMTPNDVKNGYWCKKCGIETAWKKRKKRATDTFPFNY